MASPIVREPGGFDPFSHCRSAPAVRAMSQTCLCLCLGFSQITCMTLRLRTTSHLSHIGLTLARTFKVLLLVSLFLAWNRKWRASSAHRPREAPFWPSSIRPLKVMISYPSQRDRRYGGRVSSVNGHHWRSYAAAGRSCPKPPSSLSVRSASRWSCLILSRETLSSSLRSARVDGVSPSRP